MAALQAFAAAQPTGAWAARADASAGIADAYERYAPELIVYVARRFGGHVVPEDVVHEAFARLVREASEGRMPDLARPWLYRVAHNLAVSELRRPARPATGIAAGNGGDEAWSPEPTAPSAELDYEAWALSPELRRALGALSPSARTTVLMAADGYNGREIASALGRSELAARALLCRSRRVLRTLLGGTDVAATSVRAPQLAA